MHPRVKVFFLTTCSLILFLFCIGSGAHAQKPKELELERALLQQLHPVIRSSMQEIFHEQYPFFACERIESLNEQVTMKEEGNHARAVDAMHGAHYFTITVSVCKTSGETVELYLKNDTSTAAYYLEGFRIK